MDHRTRARELVMQALYQLEVQKDIPPGEVEVFLRENTEDEMVLKLAVDWAKGAWENIDNDKNT